MKAKKSLIVLLLALVLGVSIATAACSPQRPSEGPETGVYYCDTESKGEYLLTLGGGDVFALSTSEGEYTGTYKLKDAKLTLVFGKGVLADLDATYDATARTISMKFQGDDLVFALRTYVTVTFDSKGGTTVDPVKTVKGKSIMAPHDPERQDFDFAGWYKEDNTPFTFGLEKVTSDITLHAMWDANSAETNTDEYRIDFVLGYDATAPEAQTTTNGKIGKLPDAERENYNFEGWYFSHEDSADRLTAKATEDTVLEEDVTLYAQWTERGKSAIVVSVTDSRISWNSVEGVMSYSISITDENGNTVKEGQSTTTNFDPKWSEIGAGVYTVKVSGGNFVSENRYFANKRLARPSGFAVNNNGMLRFKDVAGADKYYVTVTCADENHNHTDFDNGPSTVFNLGNCPMPEDGIKVVVRAAAEGRYSSPSREFVVTRTLDKIEADDYVVDEENEVISWSKVDNASEYIVSITCGDTAHNHDAGRDNLLSVGNKTSYCYKTCTGTVSIAVYPRAKGYFSPVPVTKVIHKETLPAPTGIKMDGAEIKWNVVEGASHYVVKVNGSDQPDLPASPEPSLNIEDLVSDVAIGGEIRVAVMAKATDGKDSLWSDEVVLVKEEFAAPLTYKDGKVYWHHVFGATQYEVKVNGEVKATVTDGSDHADIKLTQAGDNEIVVTYYNEYSQRMDNKALTLTVFAHTILLDSQGGTQSYSPIYIAVGDKVELPVPTRTSYEFGGWYNAPGGADANGAEYTDLVYNESGSIALFAYWQPQQTTVKFVYGDKVVPDTYVDTMVVRYGEKNFQFPTVKPFFPEEVFVAWCLSENDLSSSLTDEFGKALSRWNFRAQDEDEDGYIKVYPYTTQAFDFTKINGEITVSAVSAGIARVSVVTIPAYSEINNTEPVISLGSFENCANLKLLRIPNTVANIPESSFDGCPNLSIEVYTPELTSPLARGPYESSDGYLIQREYDQNRNIVGRRLAFVPNDISGATVIPSSVTSIGINAFAGKNVTRVTIPGSVNKIESGAFQNCKTLREVDFLPSDGGQVAMYSRVFSGCTALKKISLPRNFSLGDTGITIYDIFNGATALESVSIEQGNASYVTRNGMVFEKANNVNEAKLVFCPAAHSGKVDIVSGTRTIGENAFRDCRTLTSVTLPNSVTVIETNAFTRSSLQSITIGNGVRSIGDSAFNYCTKLKTVTFVSGSNLQSIGENAFVWGDGWRYEMISEGVPEDPGNPEQGIPSRPAIPPVYDWVFRGQTNNVLMGVVLPSSVTTVGTGAFAQCNRAITTLDLPKLNEVGYGAFYNVSSLTWAQYDSQTAEVEERAFDGTQYLKFLGDNEIVSDENGFLFKDVSGELQLIGYTGLNTEFELPRQVPSALAAKFSDNKYVIGEGAFMNNCSIKSVVIPNNVEVIGEGAFSGAMNLESVTIEQGVKTIENSAFGLARDFAHPQDSSNTISATQYATALTEVVLPSSVETLGDFAFRGNIYLTKFEFQCEEKDGAYVGLKRIGSNAFEGCWSLRTARLPDSLTTLWVNAYMDCTGLYSVTFGKSLGNYDGDTGLYKDGVTGVFENCVNLFEVRILGDNLRIEKDNPLYDGGGAATHAIFVDKIDSDATPSRIVDMEGCLFMMTDDKPVLYAYVGRDTEVVLPEDFNGNPYSIYQRAFYNNATLTSVTISKRVTSIGDSAFSHDSVSSALTELIFADDSQCKVIGANAFKGCGQLTEIYLPDSIETIGDGAFANVSSAVSMRLGESLVTIGDQAFSQMTKLTQIYIPDNVTTIGESAFYMCTSISTVTLGESVATIKPNAFKNCVSLKTVINRSQLEITPGAGFNDNGGIGYYLEQDHSNTGGVVDGFEFVQKNGKVTLTNYVGSSSNLILPADYRGFSYSIAAGAFAGKTGIISVTIPSGVTSIGARAFAGTSEHPMRLASVVIADGVESIGANAFEHCRQLTEIDIPKSVKVISDMAFYYCEGLQRVTLRGVRIIGNRAFSCCRSMATLNIGIDLTTIGTNVFEDHARNSLVINYAGTYPEWQAISGSKNVPSDIQVRVKATF